MDYADVIARLGRDQMSSNTAPATNAPPTLDRLKSLIQVYAGGVRKKVVVTNKVNQTANYKATSKTPLLGWETPAETLARMGRSLIAKKEIFTKEEAFLFIRGDADLGRMGLIQLCGVEDESLGAAALLLLDELLLDDEIEHPSRDLFTEAFVSMGIENLARAKSLRVASG